MFWYEIFTRRSKLCLLILAQILAPNSSHKICTKFFINHCQGWMEGSFVCETVWFFSWVNTHPFDLIFVAFVPNSVEIHTWNFRKKLFQENFSEILCRPRLSSTKTCEISPYFLQFLFWLRIALKKFTQVLSYVVCTLIKKLLKDDMRKKSKDVLLSENQFCSVWVWDLLLLIPWVFSYEIFIRRSNFCLLIFGRDFSPKFVPQDWQ